MNLQLCPYQYFLLIENAQLFKKHKISNFNNTAVSSLTLPSLLDGLSPLRSDVLRHFLFLKKEMFNRLFFKISSTK
jgi:hypothetical protein